jgi:small GTP-binding protein
MVSLSKKVCLLGDFAVGKTSLARRFVHNRFEDKYLSTIGVKVSSKSFAVSKGDQQIDLTLMIWDLAGSEEFNHIRASYLRGAAGVLLVCDMTRAETLHRLQSYVDDMAKIHQRIPLVLAANKIDLPEQFQLTENEVAAVARSIGAFHFLTSAKQGDEVDTAFRLLGQLIV